MTFNSKKLLMFLIGVGVLTFIYKAIVNIDPDFGWHIKLGELTLANGRLFVTDPFPTPCLRFHI